MKPFRVAALAAALVLGLIATASAQFRQSNCNGVLANCTPSFSQNGIQSFVQTYKWTATNQLPAATATDLLTLTGSSTRTVRVTKVILSGQATSAGTVSTAVIRRSTADQGGNSTAQTPALLDTLNSTGGAVVSLYTTNPTTLGTAVGTLASCRLFLQTSSGGAPDVCAFTYGVNDDQLAVLRGASDILAVSLQSSTIPTGGTIDVEVEYTEE